MELKIHQINLRLKHTFKIAHDLRDVQKSLIIELVENGISGFGEATASNFYNISIEEMNNVLAKNKALIESYNFEEPSVFWNKLQKNISNSFVLSAVDVAINDLYAKKNKFSLRERWNLTNSSSPLTNYTIGIDSIEKMVSKLKEFPWPSYKIKLGTKEDLKIISKLRKHTDSVFRIDANCGWTVQETLKNAHYLKKMKVEFIEQPLAVDDWQGMKKLYTESELPIIADESCINEESVEKCYKHFHGINIKLMKCGGFTPAKQMIKLARSHKMKVMVGCMTESSVGISAVAQLAPLIDYVDMDGFLLIENDIADGPKIKGQSIVLPEGFGIGIDKLNFS